MVSAKLCELRSWLLMASAISLPLAAMSDASIALTLTVTLGPPGWLAWLAIVGELLVGWLAVETAGDSEVLASVGLGVLAIAGVMLLSPESKSVVTE